jgi:hypothetical protein
LAEQHTGRGLFVLGDGEVNCGGDDRHHRHAEGGLR